MKETPLVRKELLCYWASERAGVSCLPTSLSSPRVLRYRCESACVSAEGRGGSPFAAMLKRALLRFVGASSNGCLLRLEEICRW